MPDHSANSADRETIAVDGLAEAAEIRVDRWGIPHIKAASEADLFFLQGFNAARDRLWQIDLWRKRGLGLLAADFGPGYLAQDLAARHFLYRGDMAAEWEAYAPDAEAICRRPSPRGSTPMSTSTEARAATPAAGIRAVRDAPSALGSRRTSCASAPTR